MAGGVGLTEMVQLVLIEPTRRTWIERGETEMGTKQRQATDASFEDSCGSEGKGGDDHT